MTARDVAVRALRSAPVTAASRRVTRRKLRVLAYHGVPDRQNFAEHMSYIAANYVPVDEATVAASFEDAAQLPDHAVWVTFDDGDPSVVANALPELFDRQIPATMFVCPGLIESGEPFWWRVSDAAAGPVATEVENDLDAILAGAESAGVATRTERLKLVDDRDRRSLVERMRTAVGSPPSSWRQLAKAELEAWTSAGMSVGNHSWDHPCMDRCAESDQLRQVVDSHDWLVAAGVRPRSFAYPNGNHSERVEQVLEELGYELALLHDNRLADTAGSRLRVSRLRMEADESIDRLVGVVSGAQPAAVSLGDRIPVGR